jgi:hypothetical protein
MPDSSNLNAEVVELFSTPLWVIELPRDQYDR